MFSRNTFSCTSVKYTLFPIASFIYTSLVNLLSIYWLTLSDLYTIFNINSFKLRKNVNLLSCTKIAHKYVLRKLNLLPKALRILLICQLRHLLHGLKVLSCRCWCSLILDWFIYIYIEIWYLFTSFFYFFVTIWYLYNDI